MAGSDWSGDASGAGGDGGGGGFDVCLVDWFWFTGDLAIVAIGRDDTNGIFMFRYFSLTILGNGRFSLRKIFDASIDCDRILRSADRMSALWMWMWSFSIFIETDGFDDDAMIVVATNSWTRNVDDKDTIFMRW